RAFQNLMHAGIAEETFDRVFADIAITAVQLQCFVAHLKADIGGEAFRHRAVHGFFRVAGVDAGSSHAYHLPSGNQVGEHVGELELQRLKGGDRLAELLALVHVFLCKGQCRLRSPYRTGGDIDAPAVETLHRNLEAFALGAEAVLHRYAHILKDRKSTRLNSSHVKTSYAVFCLKKNT